MEKIEKKISKPKECDFPQFSRQCIKKQRTDPICSNCPSKIEKTKDRE